MAKIIGVRSDLQKDTVNIWFPEQVEPDPEDKELFKTYWKREKDRCVNGFTLADGQVYIPGWLYFHTVYWTIELDKEIINPVTGKKSSVKTKGTPLLRDVEWIVANDLQRCKDEGKIYNLVGSRGFGKALPNTTKAHLFNGEYKNMGDLEIGDILIGRNGKQTKVLSVHPQQGLRPVYEFTLADGRKIQSDENHKWGVFDRNKYKVLTTKEIVESTYKYVHKRSGYTYRYSIPAISPVEYLEQDLPIDPYILGCLIGDGSLKSCTPRISTTDQEILDYFKDNLIDYRLVLDESYSNTGVNIRYNISSNVRDKKGHLYNKLSRDLEELGLKVSVKDKFIPKIYLKGSIEQRMELLRGLMDTDGSINTNGSIEFTSISEQLCKDIVFLARSLGIRCKIGIDDRIGREQMMPQGEICVTKNIFYRVYMRTDLPIFKLTRKLNRIKPLKTKPHVSIIDIVKVEDQNTTCITVDNDEHLFLVEDFIPTHNSFMSSSFIGDAYTFIPDSECLLTGGNNPDIAKLAEKVDLGLSNIHPVFQKQRLKNNWKVEVRAGWIDKDTGFAKGSNSRILIRNYENGNNSMATNGTRPLRQIIDEIGKIPNLIPCVLDSMPSWMNDYGFFSTPILTGTGGDMEVGEDAGIIFNNPEVYNVLEIEDEYEGKGKIGRFIPVTLARNEYKYPKTLSEYLGISHPDLDKITILVSNVEECMEKYVKPRREKALKSTTSNEIIKEKAYYPILPSECFLTVSANDFPVEACKAHLKFLQENGYKPRRVELFTDLHGVIRWKDTDKMPVTDFPVKSNTNKEGVVEMIEPPISNPPWGLYVAGIDPYKVSESEYSDSLGSVFIFKRMTTDMTEPFQNMPVAWYHGRPKDIRDWHENVRMLLELYQAEAMCEANDESFIQYMIGLNKTHYLAKGQSSLKEIAPTSKFKGTYGLPATPRTIRHWIDSGVIYTKELHEKAQDSEGNKINVIGVSKILDPMLLEELVKFNKNKGNFDRVRSFCIAVSYANQLDGLAGKIKVEQEYKKHTKIIKSPFGFNKISTSSVNSGFKSPFSMKLKY